jgi:hypothetical protein
VDLRFDLDRIERLAAAIAWKDSSQWTLGTATRAIASFTHYRGVKVRGG